MNVQSFESMIEWTRDLHYNLAEVLAAAQHVQLDERAKWLLNYLKEQEVRLGDMVDSFQEQADEKALNSQIYDWESHTPAELARFTDKPFATMSYDDIAENVLHAHNEIMLLYRYLLSRYSIPEERTLMEGLLNMEERETMQISQNINRGRDM